MAETTTKPEHPLFNGPFWEPVEESGWHRDGKKLYKHQIHGIKRLIAAINFYLAHDMGTGKTPLILIAGMTLEERGEIDLPLLYMCPARLKLNVYEEVVDLGLIPYIYPRTSSKRKYPNPNSVADADVVIMSYSAMKTTFWRNHVAGKQREVWLLKRTRLLIFDECQMIKGRKSQVTQFAFRTAKIIRNGGGRVVFMSGTPVSNTPADLFTVLEFLLPMEFDNWYRFTERYMSAKMMKFWAKGGVQRQKWQLGKPINLLELHTKLGTIMDRVLMEDAVDLPGLNRYSITTNDVKVPEPDTTEIMAYITRYKHNTAMAKIQSTLDIVANCGPGTVVFSDYLIPAEALVEQLAQLGMRVGLIAGPVNFNQRQQVVHDFQHEKLDVVVAVIKAAGYGINLQRGKFVVFNDMCWSPGDMTQAMRRCYRIGTKHKVTIIMNVLSHEFDQSLYNVLERKYNAIRAVEDGKLDEVHMTEAVTMELARKYMQKKPKLTWGKRTGNDEE